MADFNTDYNKAQIFEKAFKDYLQTEYKCICENAPNKYFPDWDVSCTGKSWIQQFEVKWNDKYFDKDFTGGTACVETAKIVDTIKIASGLSLTTAHYYVFVFANEDVFYAIETQKLKALCDDESLTYKKIIVTKGDFIIQVFDKAYLLKHCIII